MTQKDVLELIFHTLRNCEGDFPIDDVTREGGELGDEQVILTTDTGTKLQVWVIDAASIREADSPDDSALD